MKILRQSAQNRAVHWGVAISIFGLIFTGILQMPVAKRYFLTEVPGLKWSGDFIFSLNLHYFFAVTLIFVAVFHAVFHSARGQFDIFPRKGDTKNSYLVIKAMIMGGEVYINGEKALDECVSKLKQATRNYAKRQLTWFSRYDGIKVGDAEAAACAVRAFLERS